MKIIEAMKLVKSNKEKIADLCARIKSHSAHLSFETPTYPDQTAKIKEWTQAALDVSRDNVELLIRIGKTNSQIQVTIPMGEAQVTKSISEWVWRRREYAALDATIWQTQGDRGLKEQQVTTTQGGAPTLITLIRHYNPEARDKALDILRREASAIDGTLEVVNAVTDLVE